MNNSLSPVEIICGIDSMQSMRSLDVEIIQHIARIAEETARNLIKKAGFAPDLETYCYVPDDDLSHEENKKERLEFESQAWHNEASHLIGISDVELDAAALTIIESGNLFYYIDTKQTEKAIISMANLLACGLLHLDQNKDIAIDVLRKKFKTIEPDVRLGEKTRKNNKSFGYKQGELQTIEREPHWLKWRQCAIEIWKEKPNLSKNHTAKTIKKRLNIKESIETIRKRI